VKPRVTHIVELKMHFLPFLQTNVLGTFLECHYFLQYDARKFDFSRVVKHTFRGYLGSC